LPLSEKARVEVYVPDLPALPYQFDANLVSLSQYTDKLRQAAFDALDEEAVLVVAFGVYHSM
jgi:hypothetical protein